MPAKTRRHRSPGEKRTAAYDCSRQQAAGDEAPSSARRATRQARRQRHRQRVPARNSRQHHDREHWQPASATKRHRVRVAPVRARGAAVQHKPARRVHRARAAPGPAAASSARRCRAATARFQPGHHAASHRRATRGRARRNPSALRATALWQACRRARHRDDQGLARVAGGMGGSRPNRAHIVSLPRITPTAMPSITKLCTSESTTIGMKSGFSAINWTIPPCR